MQSAEPIVVFLIKEDFLAFVPLRAVQSIPQVSNPAFPE